MRIRGTKVARRITAALVPLVLAVGAAVFGVSAPAQAAVRVTPAQMNLEFVNSFGVWGNAGYALPVVSLTTLGSGKIWADGILQTVQPAPGWNAVGYGTQTTVTCLNDLTDPVTREVFSRCLVKVKMEKPGTVETGGTGTISTGPYGVTVNGGYNPGSGSDYVQFTGQVHAYRAGRVGAEFLVCVSWLGRCSTV